MAAAMAVVAEEEAGETAAAAVEVAVGFESAVAAAAMAAAAVEAVEAVEAVVAVGSCRPQCTGAAAGSVVAGTAAETAAAAEEEEEAVATAAAVVEAAAAGSAVVTAAVGLAVVVTEVADCTAFQFRRRTCSTAAAVPEACLEAVVGSEVVGSVAAGEEDSAVAGKASPFLSSCSSTSALSFPWSL